MDGTLRHVLRPVSIHLTPTGDIRILLDASMVDPILIPHLDQVGSEFAAAVELLDQPHATSQILARVHAVPDVGGGRLTAIEFDGLTVHGLIDKSLVKPDLLGPFSQHATWMLRRVTPPKL